jgi:predicted nuclease of predicted toxin-antitoxin system
VKFLVDAQLPQSLSKLLIDLGFDSIHTLELPEQNKSTDLFICNLAIEQARVIITKDRDFLESYLIKKSPEKLIIVRTGNISNPTLLELFKNNIKRIEQLLKQSNLIEITNSEIVEHQ